MKIIIGIRRSAPKGGKLEQFQMVRPTSKNEELIRNLILRTIRKDNTCNYPGTDEPTYDFYITEDGRKSVTNSIELAGEVVGVVDETTLLEFNKDNDNNVYITEVDSTLNEESLPQETTVKQLEKIRKISKKTDIGDRISDMNKQGANIQYIHNPIDTGIESIQDYWKKNNKKYKYSIKRFNQ